MTQKNINKTVFTIATIIAAGILFGASGRHPYSYYIILRWVTFGVCVFGIVMTKKLNLSGWVFWIFLIIGLVFNPVIPFYMNKNAWWYWDAAAGLILPATNIFIWKEWPEAQN